MRTYEFHWLRRVAALATMFGILFVVAPAFALRASEAPPEEGAEEGAGDEAAAGEAAAGEAAAGEAAPAEAAPAEVEYPEEALALLPREALDAIPKVLTRFLRGKDYTALKAACPQAEIEQVIECLGGEAASKVLEVEYPRALASTILGYMDAELSNRLTDEELDAIVAPCDKIGERWATCALEKGDEDPSCAEPEGELATCITGHDRVTEVYLALQKERKAVFGADFYVQFRGFLALLTIEQLRELRAACPGEDMEKVLACLDEQPLVSAVVDTFQAATAAVLQEAQSELTAAGKPLTEEQLAALSPRVEGVLYRLPFRVIDNLDRECKKLHPELEVLDDPAEIERTLDCFDERADIDPISNPAYISRERLKQWLRLGKEKVITKLREKEIAAQGAALGRVMIGLAALTLLGVLIILSTPLRLGGRYPDKKGQLWRASGFAALTFALTMGSLGVTLAAMRVVQGAVAVDSTSPKMRIAHAVFDVLDKENQVQLLSELSKERLDFIKTPLQEVVRGAGDAEQQEAFVAYVATHWAALLEEPELKTLAKNASLLKDHADSFRSVISIYRRVDWLMGLVPIVMALLAVLLYLLPMKDTLVDIVTAPARAARGEDPNAFAGAMNTVKGEFKLILPFLALMLLVIPVVGVFIALAVEPIVELLFAYLFQTVWYILGADVSPIVVDLSIGGAMALLVAAIAIFILAMGQLLGATRKLLRARFHWGQPLARYGRFMKLAPLASLAVLSFPVLFAYAVHYVAFEVIAPTIDFEKITTTAMLGIPLGGLLAFLALFWALRGFKLMKFVSKYPFVRDAPAGSDPPAA